MSGLNNYLQSLFIANTIRLDGNLFPDIYGDGIFSQILVLLLLSGGEGNIMRGQPKEWRV